MDKKTKLLYLIIRLFGYEIINLKLNGERFRKVKTLYVNNILQKKGKKVSQEIYYAE